MYSFHISPGYYENVKWDYIKNHTKVQKYYVYSTATVHQTSFHVKEGNQVGLACFVLNKSIETSFLLWGERRLTHNLLSSFLGIEIKLGPFFVLFFKNGPNFSPSVL